MDEVYRDIWEGGMGPVPGEGSFLRPAYFGNRELDLQITAKEAGDRQVTMPSHLICPPRS